MNREKSIFEQMGGTYVQVGGYLLPQFRDCYDRGNQDPLESMVCFAKSYLKDYKPGWYQSMLLTGKLDKQFGGYRRTGKGTV